MKIKNNKIVECTDDELFEYYLKAGFDEIFPYTEYREQCERHGTKVIMNENDFCSRGERKEETK